MTSPMESENFWENSDFDQDDWEHYPNNVFQRLRNPPAISFGFERGIINDGNVVFIGNHFHHDALNDNDVRLVKYDLNAQKIITEYKYPTNMTPSFHRCCVDEEKNLIYFMGGENHEFASFNYKTMECKISICKQPMNRLPNAVFIPSPINELHLTLNNTHYRYDEAKQELIKLCDEIGTNTTGYAHVPDSYYSNFERLDTIDSPARFVYNKYNQQLMMFQEGTDNILICDIKQKKQESYNWREYEVRLPQKMESWKENHFVLGGGGIVFYFLGEWDSRIGGFIWCLDILQQKWFKSDHVMPYQLSVPFIVRDKQNNAHFVDCDADDSGGSVGFPHIKTHCKVSLYDLVPLELMKSNKKTVKIPLIMGYLRRFEKITNFPQMPSALKTLIINFYPIFI